MFALRHLTQRHHARGWRVGSVQTVWNGFDVVAINRPGPYPELSLDGSSADDRRDQFSVFGLRRAGTAQCDVCHRGRVGISERFSISPSNRCCWFHRDFAADATDGPHLCHWTADKGRAAEAFREASFRLGGNLASLVDGRDLHGGCDRGIDQGRRPCNSHNWTSFLGLCSTGRDHGFERSTYLQVFDLGSVGRNQSLTTARQAGLVACRRCGQVDLIEATTCARCGAHLQSRDTDSLQKVWAWLIAGMIAYIPANIYPILLTRSLGHTSDSTIIGGVIELIELDSYGVALIVFVASVMIPIGKFIAIMYLAISVQRQSIMNMHQRHRLYDVVEFIGRWSMIDVFVVAILSALVQLDSIATINPGIAAVSFALSVIFTMLAAQSFDPRLIWDASRKTT